MCAPLCDAIAPPGELSAAAEDEALGTVGVSSQAMLDYLERANLFVTPLDAEQHWYRYHRLFSEALRHRLALQGDGRVAELRKLACDWFAAHNFPQDAVSQALAANDWERAAELLTAVVEDLLSRGQFHTLIDWFRAMPPSIVSESPRLCLDFANALLLSGEIAQGEVWLERVREFVRRDPVPDVASAPRYQGELFAAKSALAPRRANRRAR